ncbi:hypothetical protein [Neobacillus sp. Marseille-QA0830]
MKNYHCCATCKNFQAERKNGQMVYLCSRLGYQTKTTYKFNCWDPRDDIKKRITGHPPMR